MRTKMGNVTVSETAPMVVLETDNKNRAEEFMADASKLGKGQEEIDANA